jgi:hypothetical protein
MSEPPVDPELVQYPPPQHPPPRALSRSRRRLLLAGSGLVLVGAALVALVLLEPTLFGGTVLDRGAVEHDVAGQFQQREGVAVTIRCPAEMALVAGGSYRCTGTTATGERVPIRIVVIDAARAAYSWTLR